MANSSFIFYRSVVISSLLAFVVGLALAWSSPVLPTLEENSDENPLGKPIDGTSKSWLISLLSLGAAIGPFIAGFTREKYSQKWTMFGVGILFAISFILLAFAKSVALFLIGRVLIGLGVGGTFATLPNYIAEISHDEVRGTLGAGLNTFLITGLTLSYIIGPFTSIMTFSLICAGITVIFVVLFGILNEESPRCLAFYGKIEEAKYSMNKLRGDGEESKKALEEIYNELGQNEKAPITTIFKDIGCRRALIVSAGLVCFQQTSGINVVLFNAQEIFEATGSTISPEYLPMIIAGVQIITSFISPLAVDKFGRKILLIISGFGMLLSETPLGVYFYLKDEHKDVESISWLPIVCLVLYIVTYNVGFGPLPWTVMAELFPQNVKSIATSLTAGICWTMSFLITHFEASISGAIGRSGTFWLFSACNFIAALFTIFFVPETKGKTPEEIKKILKRS